MLNSDKERRYALYIHGLGSGAASGTRSSLSRHLGDYEWISPEVNENPEESIAKINEYVAVFQPALIAGTSMGGLYTAYADACSDTIKICCNPTMNIEHTLRKRGYGVHKYNCEREDGSTEYVLNEEVVRRFIEFKKSHSVVLGAKNLGVFSKDDEFVGQVETRKNAKMLEEAGFTIYWSDKFGHRLNDQITKKLPSLIKEL